MDIFLCNSESVIINKGFYNYFNSNQESMPFCLKESHYNVISVCRLLPQVLRFPVACGHRRCIFTGRSSRPLRDILLSVDENIPSEEQVEEFKNKAMPYLNDIKAEFEKPKTKSVTQFQFMFSGSAVERFGIPYMILRKPKNSACCHKDNALDTDLDVMFCSVTDEASFSGERSILVEPLITEGVGFTCYAKLTSLTPGFQGNCVSSLNVRDQAIRAVGKTRVSNLPGVTPCCFGLCENTPNMKLEFKGTAIKIRYTPFFEMDITLCIHCPE